MLRNPSASTLLVGRLPEAPDELLGLVLGLGAVGALLAAGLGRGDCYLRWASASRIGLANHYRVCGAGLGGDLFRRSYTGLDAVGLLILAP